MPGFDPNILKPEEQLSGFGLSEPDGDIFALKEDYPEEVPQFDSAPEALIEEYVEPEEIEYSSGLDLDADGITQAPLIETPEGGSVWDAFDDDPAPAVSEVVASVEEEEAIADTVEEITQEEPNAEEDLPAFEDDEEIPDDLRFDNSEPEPEVTQEDDTPDLFEAPEDDSDISADDNEVTLSLDEDLKQMLEEEINRSKARREEIESKTEDIEQIPLANPEDFKPVEQVAETEFVDITALDADEKKQPTAEEKVEKTEPVIEQKPPKKKSKLLRNISISSAAAVLLAALGLGVFQYWYYPNFMIEETQIAEAVHEEKHEETPAEDKHTTKDDNATAHEEPVSHEEPQHEEQHAEATNTDLASHEVPKNEEHTATHEPHETPVAAPKKQEIVKEEHKETVKVAAKPVEAKPTAPIVHKESKPAAKDIATQSNTVRTNKKTTSAVKTKPVEQEDPEALYAVQIYASPSKDDAETWLDNLKGMDVDNPRISTQKIRDVIWYRVRFGNFKSKDDARDAAMRYGFAQTWIDRIK